MVSSPPRFDCRVFSQNNETILVDPEGRGQDIIFSITVSNRESEYMLKEFDVIIPLAHVAQQDRSALMETYDGQGPRMLSNLRFNVLADVTRLEESDLDVLVLRLLPRAATDYITMKTVSDLSFLLTLAKINAYHDKTRVVTLYTREYYKDHHETDPIKNSFSVTLESRHAGR